MIENKSEHKRNSKHSRENPHYQVGQRKKIIAVTQVLLLSPHTKRARAMVISETDTIKSVRST